MTDPIWRIMRDEGRTLIWLARATRYSAGHVRNMRRGVFPTTARFRALAAVALRRPEQELFGDARPVEVA